MPSPGDFPSFGPSLHTPHRGLNDLSRQVGSMNLIAEPPLALVQTPAGQIIRLVDGGSAIGTGSSGEMINSMNVQYGGAGAANNIWWWLGYDYSIATPPNIPPITVPGTYQFALDLTWVNQANGRWINLTIEDPGSAARVYGPGFTNGVASPSLFEGSARGGANLASFGGTIPSGSDTIASAQPSWIFRVNTAPWTPKPLITADVDKTVLFNSISTLNHMWFSLVRIG